MTYHIHVTASAAVDMVSMHGDLSVISPELAERVYMMIEKAIASLSEFPKRYALAPEAAIHGKEIRQLVVGNYRILYMVVIGTVSIARVRHTAQAPLKADELN